MRKELQALNLLLCFSMRPGSRVPREQGGRSGSLQARAAGRPAQTSCFVLQGSSLEVFFFFGVLDLDARRAVVPDLCFQYRAVPPPAARAERRGSEPMSLSKSIVTDPLV